MHLHATKKQGYRTKSTTCDDSRKMPSHESTSQVIDNRPKANAQRKLQAMTNNYHGVNQLKAFQNMANNYSTRQQQTLQKKENNTGLPDNLKTGIQNLSGYLLDDVKVHYNSDKPAQMQAHAYAQGTDIHLGPGQEKHLPHEAWHVVQQKQGRVRPTLQTRGILFNDNSYLEYEADEMGARAIRTTQFTHTIAGSATGKNAKISPFTSNLSTTQLKTTATVTKDGLELRRDSDLKRLFPEFDFSKSSTDKYVYRHMSPKSLRLDAAETQLRRTLIDDPITNKIISDAMNLLKEIQKRATSWENYVEGQTDQFLGFSEPNSKLSDTYDSMIIHSLSVGIPITLSIITQEWGAIARQLAYKDLKANNLDRSKKEPIPLYRDILNEARESLMQTGRKLGLRNDQIKNALDIYNDPQKLDHRLRYNT